MSRTSLRIWLSGSPTPWAPEPRWEMCTMPDNGMANETLVFDVGPDRYVARLAPHQDSPVPGIPGLRPAASAGLHGPGPGSAPRCRFPKWCEYEEDPQLAGYSVPGHAAMSKAKFREIPLPTCSRDG